MAKANKAVVTETIAPVVAAQAITPAQTVIQSPQNPLVADQIKPAVIVEPTVNVTPNGQVFLSPVSASHPVIGKGFKVELTEEHPEQTKRGRQAGTGRITEIVSVITSIKNTPEKHGKTFKIAEYDSPQAAGTDSAKLRKDYKELTTGFNLMASKVKDANGKEIGSKLYASYGIPVA